MSMANNDPVDSTNRLQMIKAVKASATVRTLTSVSPEHQTMAYFIAAGARLNPSDISEVTMTIIDHQVH